MAAIQKKLSGGKWQSIRGVRDVADEVLKKPALFDELFECLFDDDPIVRSRAAHSVMRITSDRPDLVEPYKEILLNGVALIRDWIVRDQFCKIIVRLKLNQRQISQTTEVFLSYLDDKSSIVRTCALQGLSDLAFIYPELKPEVTDIIESKMRNGTAAMRARGRKLLARLYKDSDDGQ